MKIHEYIIPVALAAVLAGGCDSILTGEEGDEQEGTVTVTLNASGAVSKAGMDESLDIVWNNNDEVLINGEKHTVSPDGQNPAKVTVTDVYESDGYVAIFPYSKQYTKGESYLVDVPKEQFYSTDMPVETYPMIGYGTSTDIRMSGICGIIKIGVEGSGELTKVTVSSNNADDFLAGTMDIPMSDVTGGSLKDSYPDFCTDYSVSGSVAVSFDRGLVIEGGTKYIYAVIPARTYSSGLSIGMRGSDGNVTHKTDPVTVKRATVTDLGVFTLGQGGDEPVEPEYGDINITSEGSTDAIAYEITADPDSRISVSVVSRNLWDKTAGSGSYQSDEEVSEALLLQYGTEATTGTDGKYAGNTSEAYDTEGLCAITPDTEYMVLAGYTDGSGINGTPAFQSVRTLAGQQGEEVQLYTEILPGEKDYKLIYTKIRTTGATEIKVIVAGKGWYDELAGQGKTDSEMLTESGTALEGTDLEAANSEEGLALTWRGIPSTEFVFMALAKGENGDEKIETKFHTTSAYLPEDAQWKTISTDGYMECGLLSGFFEEPIGLGNLTIEQLGDHDIFRIPNPFAEVAAANPDAFSTTDGHLLLDARDGKVLLESFENYPGLIYTVKYPEDTYGMSFVSALEITDGEYSYGSYNKAEGIIDFGDIAMRLSDYDNTGYYSTGSTTLWFHNPNTEEPDPVPESPGLSLEDFEIIHAEW